MQKLINIISLGLIISFSSVCYSEHMLLDSCLQVEAEPTAGTGRRFLEAVNSARALESENRRLSLLDRITLWREHSIQNVHAFQSNLCRLQRQDLIEQTMSFVSEWTGKMVRLPTRIATNPAYIQLADNPLCNSRLAKLANALEVNLSRLVYSLNYNLSTMIAKHVYDITEDVIALSEHTRQRFFAPISVRAPAAIEQVLARFVSQTAKNVECVDDLFLKIDEFHVSTDRHLRAESFFTAFEDDLSSTFVGISSLDLNDLRLAHIEDVRGFTQRLVLQVSTFKTKLIEETDNYKRAQYLAFTELVDCLRRV
jgi:hypothetical protein